VGFDRQPFGQKRADDLEPAVRRKRAHALRIGDHPGDLEISRRDFPPSAVRRDQDDTAKGAHSRARNVHVGARIRRWLDRVPVDATPFELRITRVQYTPLTKILERTRRRGGGIADVMPDTGDGAHAGASGGWVARAVYRVGPLVATPRWTGPSPS